MSSRYQEPENPQSMAAVTQIRRSQLSWASAAWDVDQQGEPLEWQRYIDFIGWCSRYRMSMAKNDLLGEGSSSICRKACLTLMLVCEDLGSSQIQEVFQSYKETTQHQTFFLNTNATASFFLYIQRMLTILLYNITKHLIL